YDECIPRHGEIDIAQVVFPGPSDSHIRLDLGRGHRARGRRGDHEVMVPRTDLGAPGRPNAEPLVPRIGTRGSVRIIVPLLWSSHHSAGLASVGSTTSAG